jgi:hypothetical protein
MAFAFERVEQLLPRFGPLQRFSNLREPPMPNPFLPGLVIRCAPRVSHPLDALLPLRSIELISSQSRSWGFPYEASPSLDTDIISDAVALLAFTNCLSMAGLPAGFCSPEKAPLMPRGLAGNHQQKPPWISLPFEVFTIDCGVAHPQMLNIPSRAFSVVVACDSSAGAPGF